MFKKRLRNSYHAREQQYSKPPTYTSSNGVVSSGNKYSVSNLHLHSSEGTPNNKDAKKNKKKDNKRFTKADIGIPKNFRHISHVGWDINKGFDASVSNEECPEMKEFFQKAGVSAIQLQDRETRDFIYSFIQTNGGLKRVVNELQSDKGNDVVSRDNSYHRGARHERDALSAPPPLPMRNTPLPPSHTPTASRAAPQPPPPPSRTMPAPPPPTQTPPPPPPPLRALPQQPPAPGSGAPPPPPPPPMLAAALPPPPMPLPATPAPDMDNVPAASDPHSALMESIRSGKTLRKVDVDAESRNSNDSRGELLTQIRQGISLRPVQPVAKPPSGPPENSLASALAIALAERSRFIHSESSSSSEEDEDEDDDEWED
ncbi:hypothetical protein J6590_023117 [Homalodisca vitripennis]|nr:hypothetical protein J6590_023117 [Homalodisca vitripennis]